VLPGTKSARNPSVSVNLRDVGAGAGHKANLREGVMFRASQILRRAPLAQTAPAFQLHVCAARSAPVLSRFQVFCLLLGSAVHSPSFTASRGLQRFALV
jgi:hypothetical protein